MNDSDLTAAFHAHKDGQKVFSRRMAINIADFFEMPVKTVVKRLELLGLLKRGSWDWFVRNGGFTKEHYRITREDRAAAPVDNSGGKREELR